MLRPCHLARPVGSLGRAAPGLLPCGPSTWPHWALEAARLPSLPLHLIDRGPGIKVWVDRQRPGGPEKSVYSALKVSFSQESRSNRYRLNARILPTFLG